MKIRISRQLLRKMTRSFLSCSDKMSTRPVELRAPTLWRERLENNNITHPSLLLSEWRLRHCKGASGRERHKTITVIVSRKGFKSPTSVKEAISEISGNILD